MPEHVITRIEDNGCLRRSFAKNLAKDWRPLSEIRKRVMKFQGQLSSTRRAYYSVLKSVLARRSNNVAIQVDMPAAVALDFGTASSGAAAAGSASGGAAGGGVLSAEQLARMQASHAVALAKLHSRTAQG